MLVALFSVTILANMLNVVVLGPAGLAEEYHVVTVIAAMALVLIYVGVWYDEERQEYWEFRTERIVGDVIFVVVGAIVGSGLAIVSIGEFGFSRLLQDVLAMVSGFVVAWGCSGGAIPNCTEARTTDADRECLEFSDFPLVDRHTVSSNMQRYVRLATIIR